jgi:SAM-dependent methyltransferase
MSQTFRHRAALVDRTEFILQEARGAKRVLHVGCTDAPYTQERLAAGELLHTCLAAEAVSLVGIDISRDGLSTLGSYDPELDLRLVDIETDDLADEGFDCIILGEVLEHLGSPLRALQNVAMSLAPGGQVIITVPSAHALKAAIRACRGIEVVHPDHFAYFSPRVLDALLRAAGFSKTKLAGQYLAPGRARAMAVNRLLAPLARSGGLIGDGIIMKATAR